MNSYNDRSSETVHKFVISGEKLFIINDFEIATHSLNEEEHSLSKQVF